jgi:pyruvate/2-oxoglutarate dehydrogenase complex dihydrolipoamide dehydrogenase (E3) component
MDVIIIGAGPAGVFAARRAADLGAKTTLITRNEFGGMGAWRSRKDHPGKARQPWIRW